MPMLTDMRGLSERMPRRSRSLLSVLRHHHRDLHADDVGLTLVDVLVSMTIMTVITALFTAGIVQMYRMVNGTDDRSVAQSQVAVALLRLDKDIRYAAGVSVPYTVASNQNVDFLVPKAGSSTCVQLRVVASTRQLQRRTWVWKANPLNATPWVTLASNVSSLTPFTYTAPTAEVSYQRLTVDLKVTTGPTGRTVTKNSKVTYTALNTTTASNNNDCIAGR
jgi:type II secretory pathway component PulJ